MIDDLVESSLGFLKERRKRREESGKKRSKKAETLEHDVTFVSRIVFYALSV